MLRIVPFCQEATRVNGNTLSSYLLVIFAKGISHPIEIK